MLLRAIIVYNLIMPIATHAIPAAFNKAAKVLLINEME